MRIEAETTALVVAAPTPCAPPPAVIAVIAAHQRDDEAEHAALTRPEITSSGSMKSMVFLI